MDRRSFLHALSAPLAVPAANAISPRRDRLDRIGVQLYTLRDLMGADVARTLERVAAIGYREVEFAGYFGESPGRLRLVLDAVGLAAPSAHVSLEELSDDSARVLDSAEAIGHRYLVVPSLAPGDRATLDDFRRVAARLNQAGEAAAARGLHVAYHNHDFELATLEGRRPYDVLLQETDPRLVAFEMDFYWMVNGGADPLAYFARHPGRFHLCHAKDRGRRGAMADVGAGRIDFRALLAAGGAAGLRHVYVEHDHPADPLASVRASYRYLAALDF